MKILHIVGARPQFIKAATISRVLENGKKYPDVEEVIVHTGQHYDQNMSDNFFWELEIPEPNYNLEVGSASHAKQTGLILKRVEKVLMNEEPDWVIVYGDTNSTAAGALAAVKLHLKIAHVEAGLRSHNRKMPEEINRLVADVISDVLFAPTRNAMKNLKKEGLSERAVFVGDVMYDSILFYQDLAEQKATLDVTLLPEEFYLATIHRQENTDDPERLRNIFTAFSRLDAPIILPLHPRTRKMIKGISFSDNVKIMDPVGYLDMIRLLKRCKKVLTDSGGLQKEAYFLNKPCITLRDETEWVETLQNNWNCVVGTDVERIIEKVRWTSFGEKGDFFGRGDAAEKILDYLLSH